MFGEVRWCARGLFGDGWFVVMLLRLDG